MKTRILAALAATLALVLTGCGGGDPTQSDSGGGEQAPSDTIVVGGYASKDENLVNALKDGRMGAIVDFDWYQLGYQTTEQMLAAIRDGEPQPEQSTPEGDSSAKAADEPDGRARHDHRQDVAAEVVRAERVGGGGGGQLGGDVDRLDVIGRPDEGQQSGQQDDCRKRRAHDQ